jgi:hypothetical protein
MDASGIVFIPLERNPLPRVPIIDDCILYSGSQLKAIEVNKFSFASVKQKLAIQHYNRPNES